MSNSESNSKQASVGFGPRARADGALWALATLVVVAMGMMVIGGVEYVRASERGLLPALEILGWIAACALAVVLYRASGRVRGAMAASQEAVGRFNRAVEAAEQGIWEADLTTGRVYHSARGLRLLGLDQEYIPGGVEWFRSFVHPEDAPRIIPMVERCVEHGEPYTIEFRVRVRGEERWFRSHGMGTRAVEGGRVTLLTGSITDITQERAVEQGLREAVLKFETLASLAPVGIFQTSPEGKSLYVNERWCEQAGMSREEAEGRGWERSVHPEDRERVTSAWYRFVRDGGEYAMQERLVRPDGTEVWVIARALALRDAQGRATSYLGTTTDVTALKKAEDRLRESLAEQQRAASRESLLRRELDHRVRNNLSSLLGLIRVCEEEGASGRLGVAERLRAIVRTMADTHDLMSRLPGQAASIEDLLAMLLRGAGTEEAAGRVSASGPCVLVAAQRVGALAMILQELITNSLKHGALGTPEGRIEVSWGRAGDHPDRAEIAWRESGVGARGRDATGDGLALIRALAASDLHGSCQTLFSPEGLNCTISLWTASGHPDKLEGAHA